MTDEAAKENDGRVTVAFTLARGPLSTEEQAEFMRDLATILGVPTEEISFVRQYKAPHNEGESGTANSVVSQNVPQI